MKLFSLLVLIASLNSFAHIKIGSYIGSVKSTNEECIMQIKEVSFINNIKHPLNERVLVNITESILSEFSLSHLPIIKVDQKKIGPEKGILSGVIATGTQTAAVRLSMIHTDAYTGPGSYHFIRNEKNQEAVLIECMNLSFIGNK